MFGKIQWLTPRARTIGAVAILLLVGGVGPGIASCSDPTASPDFATKTNGASTLGSSPLLEAFNEDCPAGSDWIPGDGGPPPPVRMFEPPPHPDTECPFYRGAYQNFLIATNPLPNGDPALVNYPTISDTFQFSLPHQTRNTGTPYPLSAYDAAAPASGRAWLGIVRQAGLRNTLVDQDGHTLYYGIHFNQAFYNFIKQNGLDTREGINNVDPNLSFPPGLVEFKTAWKDIDPQDFPDANGQLGTPNGVVPPPPEGDFGQGSPYAMPGVTYKTPTWDDNYITTMAWIPYLTQDPTTGEILEDPNHPLLRKVALVAIHSVYTLPGHPEFVWGSIQHVNLNAYDPAVLAFANTLVQGAPDSQPFSTGPDGGAALPTMNNPTNANLPYVPSMKDYLLYKGGTTEGASNTAFTEQGLSDSGSSAEIAAGALVLDEATQSFPGQQESIYRIFPGSKADTLEPDTAVFSLNSNVGAMFNGAMAPNAPNPINPTVDKRFNYRLVAAVWMDKPFFFGLTPDGGGQTLQNDPTSPLLIGSQQTPPNVYPNVSQGTFCGTPLTSPPVSGDQPQANGSNNTVPGCSTRADDLARGDNPLALFSTITFTNGFGDAGANPSPLAEATGTDYEFSLLGGEDRMSSTSMESFTQVNNFHNCFACHNTMPVSSFGVPYNGAGKGQTPILTKPANINVSHVFSEFILEDMAELTAAGLDAGAP